MKDWKGCRGLEPAVASNVLNAMPPYLIGHEATTLHPFSATRHDPWLTRTLEGQEGMEGPYPEAHPSLGGTALRPLPDNPQSGRATCWEVLTLMLGKFAKEQSDKGVVMTDEILQRKARRILYDSDDTWDQTAADNPEWLDLFKKAHGLDYIPTTVGGAGPQVPEDLEMYGDLGLRIPFSVQLERGASLDSMPAGVPRVLKKYRDWDGEPAGNSECQEERLGTTKGHSTLTLPWEKAKAFKTVTGSNLIPGILGPTIDMTAETASVPEMESGIPLDMVMDINMDMDHTTGLHDKQMFAPTMLNSMEKPAFDPSITEFIGEGEGMSGLAGLEDFNFDELNFGV